MIKRIMILMLAVMITAVTFGQVCDTTEVVVTYDSVYTKIVRCRPKIKSKPADSIRLDIVCHAPTIFGAMVQGGTTSFAQDLHNAKQYIPAGSFWRDNLYMDGPGATGISPRYNRITDSGYKVGMIIKWGPSSNSYTVHFATDSVAYRTKLLASLTHLDTADVSHLLCEDEETTGNHEGGAVAYLREAKWFNEIVHDWWGGVKTGNGGIHSAGIGLVMWDDYIARGRSDSAILLRNRTFNAEMTAYVNNPGSNPGMAAYKRMVDSLLKGYQAAGFDYVNLHWKEPFNGVGTVDHIVTGGYKEYFDFVKRVTGLPVMSNEVGFNTPYGGPVALAEMMNDLINVNQIAYCLWFDDTGENPLMDEGVLNELGEAYRDWILEYND